MIIRGIRVFDDLKSLIHIAAGFGGVFLGISVPVTLVFTIYQYLEKEDLNNKLGDMVEYGIGLFLGAIALRLIPIP